MSRSRKIDFRIPNAVLDAIEARRARGEYGQYRNLSEFEIGQNLYAALYPKEHLVTVDIARMKESEQDEIHDLALRLAQSNVHVASLTAEKPASAKTLLALARHWTDERLSARAQKRPPNPL